MDDEVILHLLINVTVAMMGTLSLLIVREIIELIDILKRNNKYKERKKKDGK